MIRYADFTGDSYKLSKAAAESNARYMVFCGVHFMAETADILAQPWQKVVLPDLNAGCSMADMAEIGQVEDCWESLERLRVTARRGDSAADLCELGGGDQSVLRRAGRAGVYLVECEERRLSGRLHAWEVLFLPDQHLGRNTAFAMGVPLNEMVVWDPYQINGGVSPERLRAAKDHPVEGTLQRASAVSAGACGPGPP